jgi:hypothetical protein
MRRRHERVSQAAIELARGNAGQTCIGHALWRGGVEAFNVDDKSIGLFPTLKDAMGALASLAVQP